jgi:hypothetical protein
MKKAPETRGLGLKTVCLPFFRVRPRYFFFLAGAFFFGAAFLVALFIRLILPKHQNFAIRKSQCVSYIRLFAKKVKRKMQFALVSSPFELPRATSSPQESAFG